MSDQNNLPKGTILMWSGATGEIPYSFQLCNGTNGTPDLRNRFIVGAGDGYAVGDTGGSDTHTHTVPPNAGGPSGDNPSIDPVQQNALETDDGNNLPPYYALCFIQKMFNGSFRVLSGCGNPGDDPATDDAVYTNLDNGEMWSWNDAGSTWI